MSNCLINHAYPGAKNVSKSLTNTILTDKSTFYELMKTNVVEVHQILWAELNSKSSKETNLSKTH